MARAYKLITKYTSPNQSSRKGRDITSITAHWWGAPVGQKIAGIVAWLCNPAANASAHYVVSGDTVYCIVDPDRKAWHSGSNTGNFTSIGIELDPNPSMRGSTERTAAALIADLRAVYGNDPVVPHHRWTPTLCPGDWDVDRLDALADKLTTGTAPKVPAAKPQPKGELIVDGRLGTATVKDLQRYLNKYHGARLKVDGKAGHATWKALQEALNAPYTDGLISRQSHSAASLGNGVTQGWEHTGPNSRGSQTVKLLQEWVGATVDGVWGEKTTRALQKKLNTYELEG